MSHIHECEEHMLVECDNDLMADEEIHIPYYSVITTRSGKVVQSKHDKYMRGRSIDEDEAGHKDIVETMEM
ncbi:hypothetical protein HAX54_007880, partial [Datura stramonium]|nr:hypothetical protein [Datura stramonium]